MIKIKTYRRDNNIIKISIKGHANYEEYGKDIVCASVSSIALCTINAIYAFSDKTINVEESSGNLTISVVESNKEIIILLENMLRCLKDLEKNYPSNIKISEEE